MSSQHKTQGFRGNQSTAINYSERPTEFMEAYSQKQVVDDKERNLITKIANFRLCPKHKGHHLEYFCFNDDQLVCKECSYDKHKKCLKISTTAEACKGALKSHAFLELRNKLDTVLKILKDAEERESSDMTSAHSDRKSLKSRSDDHTSNATLDRAGQKSVSFHKSRSNQMLTFMSEVNEHLKCFEFVEKQGSDEYAFLFSHVCKNIINDLEFDVTNYVEKPRVRKLSIKQHKPGESVLSLMGVKFHNTETVPVFENNKMSPKISPSDKMLTFPPIELKRKNASLKRTTIAPMLVASSSFSFVSDLDLSSTKLCSISGMTTMENDMLILCDSNFPRILIFKNDLFLYKMDIRYESWDIAPIIEMDVFVTSPVNEDHVIQYIDINKKAVVKETKIKRCEQGGIATANKAILIGLEDKVKILDHRGRQMRTMSGISGKINYVHVCVNNNIVIVTKDSVHSVTSEGVLVFSYTSTDLMLPGKPASDQQDNIYIPGLYSNVVHRLTSDGKFIDAVLNEKNKIYFPTAVCFDINYSKLYVTTNSGNAVKMFKVEK